MQVVRDGGSDGASSADVSAAALFALLWDALADVLGTAATAALVRRAARAARARCPELDALVIVREGLEYRFTVPAAWNGRNGSSAAALRELAGELRPLLIAMTGSVVVRHLERIPELRAHGILFAVQEDPP